MCYISVSLSVFSMCFPTLVLQKNCFNVVRVDSVEDSDGSDGDGGVEVVVVGG